MSQVTGEWGLHWFRRDLRVAGNPALQRLSQRFNGRVVGLFCFDPDFLQRPDFSPDRFAFFLATLKDLQTELRRQGGDLLVMDRGPRQAFAELMETLGKAVGTPHQRRPAMVSWNRDYEPFARARDEQAAAQWASWGVAVHTEADHLIAEPHDIAPKSAGPHGYYSVFTPFSRQWWTHLASPKVQSRLAEQRASLGRASPSGFCLRWADLLPGPHLPEDRLDATIQANASLVRVTIPAAGHRAAREAAELFGHKLGGYAEGRDFPDRAATSRLSIYLKNGSISSLQVMALLGLNPAPANDKSSAATFLREIAWREFYYHILWHRPDAENQAFLPQYRQLKWENRDDLFAAWTEGKTGFPIVDAGMRELNTTGWMHNRVRMIVASFLTKDLLIDWRWGERYFMNRLLDGDLAANNGGWQWAASTGCDPQPYFRIFNPELQSKKFDADGRYIARYVPELAPLVGKQAIHCPAPDSAKAHYVLPVVDHSQQRLRAMALFKKP